MSDQKIKEIVKGLVQQCNIEAISTKSLATELTNLYSSIETLERDLESYKTFNTQAEKANAQLRLEYENYKRTYVDPVEALKADRAKFDKEKFKFEVERMYQQREVEIYREIVRSLTVSRNYSESYYGGGNGSSWSKQDSTDKPSLPLNTKIPGLE